MALLYSLTTKTIMKKKVLFSWMSMVLMAFMCAGFMSCGGDDDETNGNSGGNSGGNGSGSSTEQVFTGMVSDVTTTSATISCNFTSKKSGSSLQLGVIFSTERSVVDNKQGV